MNLIVSLILLMCFILVGSSISPGVKQISKAVALSVSSKTSDQLLNQNKGPSRVRQLEAEFNTASLLSNPARSDLIGILWAVCSMRGGHLRLIHCNNHLPSMCSTESDVCPSEMFGSNGDDINKNLGFYLFTRPVCLINTPHESGQSFTISKAGCCAIIDPNILFQKHFFINNRDTGHLDRGEPRGGVMSLSSGNFDEWFSWNLKRMDTASRMTSEILILGCMPFSSVIKIDCNSPNSCPKTVKASTYISDISYDDYKFEQIFAHWSRHHDLEKILNGISKMLPQFF
jgi:hypothetical protein